MGVNAAQVVGNVLFYDYQQSKRNPTFLHRNVKSAIALHEAEISGCSGSLIDDHIRLFWAWPNAKTIKEFRSTRKFVLYVKSIRPGPSSSWNKTPSGKLQILYHTKLNLAFTVYPKEGGQVRAHLNTKISIVVATDSQGNRMIRHSTDEDFSFPLAGLLSSEVCCDGMGWQDVLCSSYSLNIALSFPSDSEAKGFYRAVGLNELSLHKEQHTRLTTRWPNILKCPDREEVLLLRYSSSKPALDLGLEVQMGWETGAEVMGHLTKSMSCNVLAMENWRRKRHLFGLPPKTEPKARENIVVVYKNTEDVLNWIKEGLGCGFCKKSEFSHIDELRMHLIFQHDKFTYSVPRKDNGDKGKQRWIIEYRVAEPDASSPSRAGSKQDFAVLAPERPFDRSAFLNHGDESWLREARLEKRGRRRLKVTPKHPDDVRAIPKKIKRRWKVPRTEEGIILFRTATKRALEVGEEVSESDEEVDMSWLRRRIDEFAMSESGVPETAKRFMQVYDRHLVAERIQGDVHLGDAVWRFVRENTNLLREEALQGELFKKVDELFEDGLISKEIRGRVIEIMEDPVHFEGLGGTATSQESLPASKVLNEQRRKPSSQEGRKKDVQESDAVMVDVNTTEARLPYDKCLCGDAATTSYNTKPIIFCESTDCTRGAFHIDCVMSHWKPKEQPDLSKGGWYCRDCVLDPHISTGNKRWYH